MVSNGLPDDHSKVVPLLPIPNRTVKRLSADDSADARVKVGHRQAFIQNARWSLPAGVFLWVKWPWTGVALMSGRLPIPRPAQWPVCAPNR